MPKYTAKTADKYELYVKSVQCVDADIDFVEEIYQRKFKTPPRSLREDFCGSFAAAVEFVSRNKKNMAYAIDLDGEVLDWGRKKHLPRISKRKDNLKILQDNVLTVKVPKVDVILAMNFSYFLFKERQQMLAYFKRLRKSLNKNGILVMDAYGGTESIDTCLEEKELDGFNYEWDQHYFNPITSEAINYIHFNFPDGSRMDKAFIYEWRVWSLREITDLLKEAGFSKAEIYWEGWDEKNKEGDGNFTLTKEAENCEGWICYIVAEK